MIQGNTLRNSWIIIQFEIGTLGVLIYEASLEIRFGNQGFVDFFEGRFPIGS
jgi:hypothetical protein